MHISDVFYLLGSIVMGLLIILLTGSIIILFVLKKKINDIQTWLTATIIKKIAPLVLLRRLFSKKP